MVDFVKHSGSGQACPRGLTQTSTLTGACVAGLREQQRLPRDPWISPLCRQGGAGTLPPRWLDTLLDRHGREKAGNGLCLPGTRQPLPPRRQPWWAPHALLSCTAPPSGHRLELGGPARPAERGRGPLVALVGLGLALGPLGLGVGGRVGLLHRHGPAQVVALPQELGLSVEAEAALA